MQSQLAEEYFGGNSSTEKAANENLATVLAQLVRIYFAWNSELLEY